jgi:mannitol-1-phosphate/altronate dehydrogenase
MNKEIKEKIIQVCDDKIAKKGENVGVSFYAFFKNKNDNPSLLIEVAKWWIAAHQLDHFEKAVKIKEMIKSPPQPYRRKGVSIIMEN